MVVQSDKRDALVPLLFDASKNMLGSSAFVFTGRNTQHLRDNAPFLHSIHQLWKTRVTFSVKAYQQHMHLLDVSQ